MLFYWVIKAFLLCDCFFYALILYNLFCNVIFIVKLYLGRFLLILLLYFFRLFDLLNLSFCTNFFLFYLIYRIPLFARIELAFGLIILNFTFVRYQIIKLFLNYFFPLLRCLCAAFANALGFQTFFLTFKYLSSFYYRAFTFLRF